MTDNNISDDDLVYEEQLLKEPYNLKIWLAYIDSKRKLSLRSRVGLYERALALAPGSYKLWFMYLSDRVQHVQNKIVTHSKHKIVQRTFERALVYMHKMPRIWLEYAKYSKGLKRITATRRIFDRALQALPVTQHEMIWSAYMEFVNQTGLWQLSVHVYPRWLQFDPTKGEEYVTYLSSIDRHGEAAQQLVTLLNDESFVSQQSKTKHELWMKLCETMAKYPKQMQGKVEVESIIRTGLKRFSDETGRLWCALSDYYIRLGEFEHARDIYEEAISSVQTVRDFSLVFDAYSQFEEAALTAKMDMESEESKNKDELDYRLARLEFLLERRPILLNSVRLRQNKHDVSQWLKRIELMSSDPAQVVRIYGEAVKTVQPSKAKGQLASLWVSFAKYYESLNRLEDAREIFKQARHVSWQRVDELAVVICANAEFEIAHKQVKAAHKLLKDAVTPPSSRAAVELEQRTRQLLAQGRDDEVAQLEDANKDNLEQRLHRNTRIWFMYLDVEEAVGTVATTQEAYDTMIGLRIATPRTILNYATFLQENKYFEESFRACEKGIALFPWPHVYEIWVYYLDKFVNRYQGTKLERARELFEAALEKCPAEHSKALFLMYINLEEKYGLIRHSMALCDRACDTVTDSDRLDFFKLYIKKVETAFGITKTREVYQRAIEELDEDGAREMSMQFARVETQLGEIDRARAIYAHGSQMCNPKSHPTFWEKWNEFEIEFGNEDSYRDMLRIKNTVSAHYSQATYSIASETAMDQVVVNTLAKGGQSAPAGFVAAATGATKRSADEMGSPMDANADVKARFGSRQRLDDDTKTNADEMNVDDEELEVEPQQIPSTVFAASAGVVKNSSGPKLGAMERLKAAAAASATS